MADLVSDDTEEVQRLGEFLLHGEDLAVERLGVRQSSCSVALNRHLKRLWNRHIAWRIGDHLAHHACHIER